jgi:glycosyltransferase 2 family protein
MDRVFDAIEVFFDRLAAVHFVPLALAIGCHVLKTMCISRAWRNTLKAAYPEERVPWLSIWAAYLGGSGVNAILPARGGDAVKLLMAHRAIPGSTYTALASSLVPLVIVDTVVASAFFGYALTQNVLPSLDVLPDLPSFDFAWFIDHPRISSALAVALTIGLLVLAFWIDRRVDEFRAHIRQGVVVLRDRPRYLRTVAFWQLCDWALRLVTIGFFLRAFDIDPSVRNVLLVQVTASMATLIPATPGGIGTEQAFIVYVFRGAVPRSSLLAFSVGMKLTLTAVNALLGFAAIALTLRTLDFRRVLRRKPAEASPDAT